MEEYIFTHSKQFQALLSKRDSGDAISLRPPAIANEYSLAQWDTSFHAKSWCVNIYILSHREIVWLCMPSWLSSSARCFRQHNAGFRLCYPTDEIACEEGRHYIMLPCVNTCHWMSLAMCQCWNISLRQMKEWQRKRPKTSMYSICWIKK